MTGDGSGPAFTRKPHPGRHRLRGDPRSSDGIEHDGGETDRREPRRHRDLIPARPAGTPWPSYRSNASRTARATSSGSRNPAASPAPTSQSARAPSALKAPHTGRSAQRPQLIRAHAQAGQELLRLPRHRRVDQITRRPHRYIIAAADLAQDVHLLIDRLGLGRAHVVGHDVGGWVAYAFARRFPDSARTVMIVETPVPGIEPWLDLNVSVPLWHGAFHMVPGLPEALVVGRQEVYFRYFFDVGTRDSAVISDADLKHYAAAYGDQDRLRSAFEIYRAVPANMTYNAGQTGPVDIPLLLVGGEHVFGPVLPRLADNLRASYGWSDVDVHIVAGGQHYLVEERPDDMAGLIERHAARR